MIFQAKHTKRSFWGGNLSKIISVFLLVLFLIFIFDFLGSSYQFFSGLFYPFIKTGDLFYKNISWLPGIFSDKNKIIEENKNMEMQIEKDSVDMADYESLKYENQKLRDILKIKPAGNFIYANIVAKSPQIPLDSLLLDRGTADGLKEGDLVLAADKVLIGKIVKLSKNISTVALDSFAGQVSYGFVARTEEPIEAKGGGGYLEAQVPIDFDITLGDKIMVHGSGDYMSAIVSSIEEDHSSGFKKIFMSLPINVSKINVVFVESILKE